MTSTNALAVDESGTTITRKAPGMLLGLLTAVTVLAMPAAAWGAETTTTLNGYSASPSLSTSTSTSSVATTSAAVEPHHESKPEAESKPKSSVKPSSSSAAPSTETTETATSTEAQTLPFTGLNLAWVIGGGLLLIAAGVSTLLWQRKRAHH
jgi:uncharacterized surface anchored protein